MNADDVLAELRRSGKPRTAAIYRRHGAGENVYGVLTSELARLRKKIRIDHDLAMELWTTGNAEARILALQVADPRRITGADADRFVSEGQSRFLACYLSALIAHAPIADRTMREWMTSSDESRRELGYGIFALRLKDAPDSVPDSFAEEVLATMEREIHASPNRARHAMNGALISIGVFKPGLAREAIEVATRIGAVQVDHGETSCKTPDAVSYIQKASRRRRCP